MHPERIMLIVATALALAACQPAPQAEAPAPVAPAPAIAAMSDADLLAQGEYLVRIAGCNDCHTPGYMDQQGKVDKALWLTGTQLGFRGPWGTTYPANLRLKIAEMDEAAWLGYTANLHTRPIMPDFAVRDMKEQDRLALYRSSNRLDPAASPHLPTCRPIRSRSRPSWS